jgi:adenosine kinase
MLDKYGMKPNDTILAEEKHMGIYEDLLSNRDAKVIAGGAAQNTARGAQYMLPPNSVWYVGCVGKDDYAQKLREQCKKEGVHTEYRVDEKEPTGKCGVVINGHNRSMCTHLAAANEYKLEHLKQPKIWSMVEKTEVFYVGGYHLTVCVPAIMALAEEALEKNKPLLLGLGAMFVPQFFKDQLAQVMPYCDYIFGNEDEAEVWAKTQGHETKDLKEIAKLMCEVPKKNKQRPRTVVITHGTQPTITARMNVDMVVVFDEVPVHKISEEEINDTNGAG